jgi:hypothetical protein
MHKILQPQCVWVLDVIWKYPLALVLSAVEGDLRYACFQMMDVLKAFDGSYA